MRQALFALGRGLLLLFTTSNAYAWYGPLCYSDKTTQIIIIQPSISGETPGDLKVDFDDNMNQVRLVAVRPSATVKGAHEVVLARNEDSALGTLGVILTSPRSTTGFKYELEFRKTPEECQGAMIRTNDKSTAIAAAKPAKPKLAKAAVKPKHPVQVAPQDEAASPTETTAQAATPVPLPTPVSLESRASEQAAGQAPAESTASAHADAPAEVPADAAPAAAQAPDASDRSTDVAQAPTDSEPADSQAQ